MALQLDITDSKGVKARYHTIRSFSYKDTKLDITLFSYVNQAMRDSEKLTLETNALALAYDATTDDLRAELAPLLELPTPDETVTARIVELTDLVNDRALDTTRPVYSDIMDTHYGEDTVTIVYDEPITLEGLYIKLASDGPYAGAINV